MLNAELSTEEVVNEIKRNVNKNRSMNTHNHEIPHDDVAWIAAKLQMNGIKRAYLNQTCFCCCYCCRSTCAQLRWIRAKPIHRLTISDQHKCSSCVAFFDQLLLLFFSSVWPNQFLVWKRRNGTPHTFIAFQ